MNSWLFGSTLSFLLGIYFYQIFQHPASQRSYLLKSNLTGGPCTSLALLFLHNFTKVFQTISLKQPSQCIILIKELKIKFCKKSISNFLPSPSSLLLKSETSLIIIILGKSAHAVAEGLDSCFHQRNFHSKAISGIGMGCAGTLSIIAVVQDSQFLHLQRSANLAKVSTDYLVFCILLISWFVDLETITLLFHTKIFHWN